MNSWKQSFILVEITYSVKSVPGRFKWWELKGNSIILRHIASNSHLHLRWYNAQYMEEATEAATQSYLYYCILAPGVVPLQSGKWKLVPLPTQSLSEHYPQNEPNCLCETGRDICRCKLNHAEGSSRVVTFYKLLSLAWLTTPHRAFSLIQQGSKQPGKKISFKEI